MKLETLPKAKNLSEKNIISQLLEISNSYENVLIFFDELIDRVETNYHFSSYFIEECKKLFGDISFRKYILESGIMRKNSIISMLGRRASEVLLPQIEDDKTLTSILNQVFYKKSDFEKLKLIPKDRWKRLYEAILNAEPKIISKQNVQNQLIDSISILLDRINGGFYESEMFRYNEIVKYHNSAFHVLSIHLQKILEKPDDNFDLLKLKELISTCQKTLNDILMQKDKKGISLGITIKINRIRQQLQRLLLLAINLKELIQNPLADYLTLFTKTCLDIHSPKNFVSRQFSSTLYLVTFLVTYHNGKTGEKYISSSAKEYVRMFFSAAGGGFIVANLCFIKLLIGNDYSASPFEHALGYSLNYAIGFVAIYLLRCTLATKQPAMTAALIAQSLHTNPQKLNEKPRGFIILFSRLVRSQFIAFIGNVFLSFPVALLIYYFFNSVLGYDFAPKDKMQKWFDETTTPYFSQFWYASIAGVFLFLSGLSSGLFINYQRYNTISSRLLHHPLLVRFLSFSKRKKMVNWYEKNSGAIVGNIVLGFFLGSAFLVGKFFKIPFDIRHITFQAGNFAIAISKLQFQFPFIKYIYGFISIFLIGWCNFIVSFSLSLLIAMRSNNVPIKTIFPLLKHVVIDFFRSPFKYFFPAFIKNKQEFI